MTRFSIVITTFNRLSLLKKAINSALNQTIPCEVIVVDDCSVDGTATYLQGLGTKIVYHRNLKNRGHSVSVNMGVELAQGDWIKLVDDDDYLAFNCIEEIKRAIDKHPEAVICSCQAVEVDLQEQEISRSRKVGSDKIVYIAQEDIHYGMLLEQVPFGTPVQIAFRRDAFLQSGDWDSKFDLAYDDIYAWVKISKEGDAIFINKCLVCRRLWPGSYHEKISLSQRLNNHILIKEEIYSLVNKKYQKIIPSFLTIQDYLKLYWGFIALSSKEIVLFFKLANFALISPQGWFLFIKVILEKQLSIRSNFSQTKFRCLK